QLEEYLREKKVKCFDNLPLRNLRDLEKIGHGGFAIVYSVTFQGKKYALKSLYNNLSLDDKAFRQIRREIKLLYSVKHPNIIKLHGVSR
ncbi:26272_t:CDS:2, partial [Gigaspora rosea]